MAGVSVPLQPVKHQYIITEKIDGLAPDAPTIRDPDRRTYFKEEVGGLVMGGYEPDPQPWTTGDRARTIWQFQLFDDDWDHFEQHMSQAIARVPALETSRHQADDQRARKLHARRQFHPRRARPNAPTCSSAPASTPSASRQAGGAGWVLARMGGERRGAARPLGRRHPPLLRPAPRPRLGARPHARGLWQALHDRLPARGVRARPAAHRLAAL